MVGKARLVSVGISHACAWLLHCSPTCPGESERLSACIACCSQTWSTGRRCWCRQWVVNVRIFILLNRNGTIGHVTWLYWMVGDAKNSPEFQTNKQRIAFVWIHIPLEQRCNDMQNGDRLHGQFVTMSRSYSGLNPLPRPHTAIVACMGRSMFRNLGSSLPTYRISHVSLGNNWGPGPPNFCQWIAEMRPCPLATLAAVIWTDSRTVWRPFSGLIQQQST